MYNFIIPKQQLEKLWMLREYSGRGPIAAQIRAAINDYVETQKDEIVEIQLSLEHRDEEGGRD